MRDRLTTIKEAAHKVEQKFANLSEGLPLEEDMEEFCTTVFGHNIPLEHANALSAEM